MSRNLGVERTPSIAADAKPPSISGWKSSKAETRLGDDLRAADVPVVLAELQACLAEMQAEVRFLRDRLGPELASPRKVAERLDIPYETVQQYLSYRGRNGLAESGAVVKRGQALSVDLPRFVAWLKNGGHELHAAARRRARR
jgi:hypothetical protein